MRRASSRETSMGLRGMGLSYRPEARLRKWPVAAATRCASGQCEKLRRRRRSYLLPLTSHPLTSEEFHPGEAGTGRCLAREGAHFCVRAAEVRSELSREVLIHHGPRARVRFPQPNEFGHPQLAALDLGIRFDVCAADTLPSIAISPNVMPGARVATRVQPPPGRSIVTLTSPRISRYTL